MSEAASELPNLPAPESRPPRGLWARWLSGGGRLDEGASEERTYRWYWVMWLTGMDYFSSLAYQAGIALLAAGALGPIATLLLVAATIFGALPVYCKVARYSYAGQGSIAMLENLLPGWSAKIFVLVLLGFAATDFVITMTLSAADAATHAVENPYLHSLLQGHQMSLTLGLLVLLGVVFLMGFQEAITVSALVGIPFVLLNVIALGAGLVRILQEPVRMTQWKLSLFAHGDWTMIFLASALVFPKLVLGMSGFETGVSVMPLISGGREDESTPGTPPNGRIRATGKLLTAAAVIMGVLLLTSSFVTTLLIPESAYHAGGPADGRAIAYLAHQELGNVFGTLYDLSTIAILWFAGASAMAGLISLIPRYLPRFGMAPRWVAYRRPMVMVLFVADVLVTMAFHANVTAQAGAFATGVLVLILSASVAAAIALGREARMGSSRFPAFLQSGYFWLVSALFTYTLGANIVERPDGVIISSIFIVFILIASATSRYQRARELRVSGMRFLDHRSAALWPQIAGKRVNLVPLHGASHQARVRKAAQIRKHYQLNGPLAFLHAHLLDNRSEFISSLRVGIRCEQEDYVIEIWGAVAIANTIAYFSELIDPKSVFLSLTGHNLMKQSVRYMLFGEGETGLMVYTILVLYWEQLGRAVPHPPLFLTSA